jgi:hypothetical protein
MGRVVSVNYTDGTPAKSFYYDAASTWTEASQQTYLKGRMSGHNRLTSVGNAGSIYGYDQMGRVTLQYSCLPSGCGNAAYDRNPERGQTDSVSEKSVFAVFSRNMEGLNITQYQHAA